MGVFDLVFIGVFLATTTVLLAAVISRRRRRLLRGLAVGLAIYFVIVIAVSLVLPRKTIVPKSDQCFDDWCVAVSRVESRQGGTGVAWDVTLRLSSRAKRVAQRENNLSVYVTDSSGERYQAGADSGAVPFNVLLQPGESVETKRTFLVPGNVADPALVLTHAGGFPIGWFIIGYDAWFRKPPAMKLAG